MHAPSSSCPPAPFSCLGVLLSTSAAVSCGRTTPRWTSPLDTHNDNNISKQLSKFHFSFRECFHCNFLQPRDSVIISRGHRQKIWFVDMIPRCDSLSVPHHTDICPMQPCAICEGWLQIGPGQCGTDSAMTMSSDEG